MDQDRSTFSTANIGRWQSTFTNGSASHGFQKEKKEVGKEKKKSDYNERLVSQKKQQQRKQRYKGRKSKLKHFSTADIGRAVRKK